MLPPHLSLCCTFKTNIAKEKTWNGSMIQRKITQDKMGKTHVFLNSSVVHCNAISCKAQPEWDPSLSCLAQPTPRDYLCLLLLCPLIYISHYVC